MKKSIFLLASLFACSANATLMFSDVSYTASSVTFTVDGDMTGYSAPASSYRDQFSLVYGGDLWGSNYETFEPNAWSRSVFDNKSFSINGNTGTSGNSYSWSLYSSSSLADAVVDSATVTLTMQNARLNINALTPTIDFVWGNGQPGLNTVLQTFDFRAASVPEPASIALLGLGLIGLGVRRCRKAA